MDFTLNNGLSMIGGDDFTNIYEEIDTLNASVVFKAGTQTITGDKTIEGILVVNNASTLIDTIDMDINSDALQLNSANGTLKYAHNATQSTIQNSNIFLADTAGTAGMIIVANAVALEAPAVGNITHEIGGNNKIVLMNNTSTLNNTTTNIQSDGTNKITTNPTTTTLNNTGGTTLQIASDPKISLLSASTTLNNTATTINSGGSLRYSNNATDTQIRNSLVQLQAGALDVKYNQTATQSDITNATILMNCTTALRQWSPTMAFGYDTTFATICSTMAFESLRYLSMAFNLDNTGLGSFTLYDAVRNYLVINTTSTTLSSPASVNIEGATSVTLETPSGTNKYTQSTTATTLNNAFVNIQAGGTTKYTQNATSTTLTNQTINLQDATPTTRFTQTNGVTTLTNTSINATGSLYATRYFCGSSGGSNTRLASFQLPLGTCLIPTGGVGTSTTSGNWSPTGTSGLLRTPEWGNFYPLYAMIGFDSGTITFGAGGTLTIAVRIREETNNYTYDTNAFSVVSGTLNAPTGSAGDFVTFSAGSNERISSGALIRFQILSTRAVASLTASTKSCYATIYGYQTT